MIAACIAEQNEIGSCANSQACLPVKRSTTIAVMLEGESEALAGGWHGERVKPFAVSLTIAGMGLLLSPPVFWG